MAGHDQERRGAPGFSYGIRAGEPAMRALSGADQLPVAERGPTGDQMITAAHLAEILQLPPPTDEQAAVIEAPMAPVLVVAGAGSGKTETMAARVLFLVANGLVRPDEVLGLTFTRKAAAGLATRIRKRLRTLAAHGPVGSLGVGKPEVSPYHSFGGRLIAEFGPLA